MKKTWIVRARIVVPVLACLLAPRNTALGQGEEAGHVLTVKKDVTLLRAGQQSPARARGEVTDPSVMAASLLAAWSSRGRR